MSSRGLLGVAVLTNVLVLQALKDDNIKVLTVNPAQVSF